MPSQSASTVRRAHFTQRVFALGKELFALLPVFAAGPFPIESPEKWRSRRDFAARRKGACGGFPRCGARLVRTSECRDPGRHGDVASDYAKRVTDWPTLEIAVGGRASLIYGRPVRKVIFVWLCSVCFNVSGLGDFPRPRWRSEQHLVQLSSVVLSLRSLLNLIKRLFNTTIIAPEHAIAPKVHAPTSSLIAWNLSRQADE